MVEALKAAIGLQVIDLGSVVIAPVEKSYENIPPEKIGLVLKLVNELENPIEREMYIEAITGVLSPISPSRVEKADEIIEKILTQVAQKRKVSPEKLAEKLGITPESLHKESTRVYRAEIQEKEEGEIEDLT